MIKGALPTVPDVMERLVKYREFLVDYGKIYYHYTPNPDELYVTWEGKHWEVRLVVYYPAPADQFAHIILKKFRSKKAMLKFLRGYEEYYHIQETYGRE